MEIFGGLINIFFFGVTTYIVVKVMPDTLRMHYRAYKKGVYEDDYWDRKELKE